MRWAAISVACPAAGEEPVAAAFVDAGCRGAAIDRVAAGGAASSDLSRVTGYLPVDDRLEQRLYTLRARLAALMAADLPVGDGAVTVRWVEEEDWAHAWKSYFRPLRVGRRFVVCPTWEAWPASSGERVLRIDPGMAFGTGAHPTTQLCLELIEARLRPGESVLDVGTGSGILAIAAAALGARPIVGIDIDPVAIAAARAGRDANPFAAHIGLAVCGPEALRGRFDWVLANLVADILCEEAPVLAARLAPGGSLLASGITTERAAEVRAALAAQGLAIDAERGREGWVALVARRLEPHHGRA